MEKENTKKSIEAFVEKIKGKLVAIASSETKDRTGDVIKASGWQLKNFKKNPVLLFAHRYQEPPVGIAKDIRVEGKNLIFEPVFHTLTQLAREVKSMFEAEPAIMRAFSVGFIPLEVEEAKKNERGCFGPETILKAELLEISAVPVPANQEALVVAAKSITEEDKNKIEKWVEECKSEECEVKKEIEEDTEDIEKIPDENGEKEEREECGDKIFEENEFIEGVKPYPNEHSCRLEDPAKYDRFARKNCYVKSDGKCIDFIFGIKKGKSELQAMRYPKDVWTAGGAAAHCKSKGGTFEAASGKNQAYDETDDARLGKFACACIDCEYTEEGTKSCQDIKCPKCGGGMREVGRPGPAPGPSEDTEDSRFESKGVIPYSIHGDGPKAPEGEPWDAGAELKKAIGNAIRLRKMHAWVDTTDENFDASERQWYKLPHHKGDGNQAVVWRGTAAAMGALLGARGGVDLPSGDRKGVYNHLAGHYKQFDKEPPDFKEYTENELKKLFLESYETEIKEIKELKEMIEEIKSGRILSGKNRKIIADAIVTLKTAISTLRDLLQATEPAEGGEGKSENGRREVAQGLLKDKAVVRALQIIAGISSDTLSKVKRKK